MIFCSIGLPEHGYDEALTVLVCSSKLFSFDFFMHAELEKWKKGKKMVFLNYSACDT